MSQINLKSITGITSITTPAGVDNVFTVHTNDTTERFRVDSNGNQVIAGILTASQGVRVPHGSATTNYLSVGDSGSLRFWATGHSYADIRSGNLHFRNNSLQNILEIQQDKDIFVYGPSYFLDAARFDSTVTIADTITHHGDTDTKIRFPAVDTVTIETAGSERLRINSSGHILKGHDAPSGDLHDSQTTTGRSPRFQLHGAEAVNAAVALISWKSGTGSYYSPNIYLARSGSDTKGTNGLVANNAPLGAITFNGDDGGEFAKAAVILGEVDGTSGADDMPGRLIFKTTPSGTQVPAERLRIDSNGDMGLGGSPITSGYTSFTIHEPGTSSGDHVRFNMTTGNTGNTGSDGFSITVNASTNNIHYIQREAADMAFQNTGGRRFTIKSDGKIGIGDFSSITPARTLHLHQVSANTAIYATFTNGSTGTAASNGFTLGIDSSQAAILNNYSNTDIKILCNGGERLRIQSDGKVKIGTGTAQLALLHIAPTLYGINLQNDSNNKSRILFSKNSAGNDSRAWIEGNGELNGYISLAAGDSERLRIDSSGTLKLNQADSMIMTNADTSRLRLFGGSSNSVNNGAALTLHGVSHSSGNYADLASGSGGHIQFRTGTNERLRIASDGKVGINESSPATILHVKGNYGDMLRLDRDNAGAVGNQIAFRHKDASGNFVETNSINGVASTNAADGNLRFSTKPSGGANTERMRITQTGKLLVGATSGSHHYISSGSDTLNTVFQANLGGAGATCAIRIKMNTSANNGLQIQQNGSGTSVSGGAHCASIINRENAPLRLGANNTEYFRIESNGHNYIQSQCTVRGELNMMAASVNQAKYFDIGFLNNSFNMRRTNYQDGGHSNFITVNSSKVVSGNFNDTSDEKLKKNIATISDGAIEDIKKLRPVTFDWIDETENDNVSGFIAQEVKQVLPNLIDGTEYDPTYNDESLGSKGGIKSVGYSINSVGVTAHLTKALQEAIAKIEVLEAKVAALEGS